MRPAARIAAAALLLTAGLPASAQVPQPPQPLVQPPHAPMTLAEYQGLSCLAAGALTGIGALGYIDPIAVVATGSLGTPLLLIPVAAAGFAVGCSVGATLSPALLWMFRRSQ